MMKGTISEKALRQYERRLHAVKLIEASKDRRAAKRAAAEAFGVSRRTVRRWHERWRKDDLSPRPLGRRPQTVAREVRQAAIALLVSLGPLASVASVRAQCRDMPYRLISSFKRRLARIRRRRRMRHEGRLAWSEPGRVWAMDFTQPKARLEGKNKRLFVVRDLASGARLACVPCRGERAMTAIKTLEALFEAHERPLAIKHDNGPAFIAHATEKFLDEQCVSSLASPAYRPQYNGSCERSLGWDKVRIAHIAAQEGHPDSWTDENIEHARLQANATLRPWGANGPTPGTAFERRKPITLAERRAFNQTVTRNARAALMTYIDKEGRIAHDMPVAAVVRRSVSHALREHGYLHIWRGRKPTPLSATHPDSIT